MQNAKFALKLDPLSLNPPDYCWKADDVNKNLYPTTVAEGVCVAPDCVLKLIRCGCDSEMPCRSGNCGCTGHQIPRTIFCAYGAGLSCLNKLTIAKAIANNEEDADNAEEDS